VVTRARHSISGAGKSPDNLGAWVRLCNETVTVAEPEKSFGGIGGGFATSQLTLPLAANTLVVCANVVHFRFNQSDGLASGYRVLDLNFFTNDWRKILLPADFAEDTPDSRKLLSPTRLPSAAVKNSG
jgi:hypothetical protein